LIASGLDIAPQDFMAGNYHFQTPINAEGGMVVNQGILEAAKGGSINLVGGAVSNEGLIYAHTGQVNLVAGKRVTMDFDGDGLIQFTIDESILENTHQLDSAVSNSGEINAEGGAVLLKGSAARDVFSNVVNNEGIIHAGRIENVGGVIRLVAGGESNSLINTGTLDASGQDGDGGSIQLHATGTSLVSGESVITVVSDQAKGGEIHVLGENVGLLDLSSLDVSGSTRGGEVLIGGDYQGKNPDILNATRTYLSDDVTINADAIESGDGGKVIVWSDEFTKVDATITARGGEQGGDGGLIETSSKGYLEVLSANVDASAINGAAGEWLLDPTNVNIEFVGGAATDDSTGGTFDGGDPNTWTPNATGSTVDIFPIRTSLEGGTSVTITTNDDAGTDGGEAGNITLLTGGSNNIAVDLGLTDVTLKLHADNNVILNNTISQSSTLGGLLSVDLLAANDVIINSAITLGGGNLTLTADAANLDADAINGADGTGNVDINATITTGGGAFLSSGINFDNTSGVINTGGGNLTVNHTGTVTLGADLNFGAGTLSGIATDVLVLNTGGSVQDGIDIIDTTIGGKVTVGDGTFTEDLSITTDNLILTSLNGKVNTTIKGVASDTSANFPLFQNATNIFIDANDVTIDDLTLQTPNVAAGDYSSLITLIGENISLTNNSFASIHTSTPPAGANDGITNFIIQSISAADAPAGSIDGLTITGNTFDGNGKGYYGIYLNQQGAVVGTLAGDEVLIDGNQFTGNIWRAISTERNVHAGGLGWIRYRGKKL
jgi:hypothetical protein